MADELAQPILPPRGIQRHGGKTDSDYLRSARSIVAEVRELCGLKADDQVLDIGCGAGRFLTGLLATFGHIGGYIGLDVRRDVIEWCAEALADPRDGDIRFEWINVETLATTPLAARSPQRRFGSR